MAMIKTIDLSRLRNDEFVQFIADISSLTNLIDTEALQLTAQSEALKKHSITLEDVFSNQFESDTVDDLVNLDQQRDFALIGIRTVLRGYTYHFRGAKKNAAQLLMSSFESYGKRIYDQNFQKETNTIRDLIENWQDNSGLFNAVNTLDISGWLNELERLNSAFDELYQKHAKEDSTDESKVSLFTLRNTVNKDYRKFIAHVTAHNTLNPEGGHGKLVSLLNNSIEQYKEMLETRVMDL